MAKRHYLPLLNLDLKRWLGNYRVQLKKVAQELGVPQQEVDELEQLIEQYVNACDKANRIRATARKAIGQRDVKRREMLDVLLPQVQRLKNHRDYEEASHGKLLGVVGVDRQVDLYHIKPKFKVVLDAGRPRIVWKKGQADAVNIYVDRRDGKGMHFLATDMNPDYVDTYPIPEGKDAVVWYYKLAYVINDKEVGVMSDQAKITVTSDVI